jgi:hypothetical protein
MRRKSATSHLREYIYLQIIRLFRLFRFYTETESFDVSIEPKQTEEPPKQFKREYIWVFFRKFRVVSVCFGFLRKSSVCFGSFDIGSKQRNNPKLLAFGFTKQTETNAKQILFRFVSVRTEIYFCLFRGHPMPDRGDRGLFSIWTCSFLIISFSACNINMNRWLLYQ